MQYGPPPREHVADNDGRRAELRGQVASESCVAGGDGDDRRRVPVREIRAQLRPGRRGPARQPEVERLQVFRGRTPLVDIARGPSVGRGLDGRAAKRGGGAALEFVALP